MTDSSITQDLYVNNSINTSLNFVDHPDDENDKGKIIGRLLWLYMSPIVFIVGLFGNTVIIILMRKKKLKGTTSSVYLSMLAIADIATLIFGIIPEWLEQCGYVIFKEINQWTCKFEKFLFYTSSDTAIWILVCFTVDRFIAVCFPLKKTRLCRKKTAKIACATILSLAIVKNFHVFWTRGATYDEEGFRTKNCGRPEPYTHFELYVRPWIAFAVVNALPVLIISSCNIFIIRALLAAQKMRSSSSGVKTFTQTTMMCMSASFTFLILITPSIIILIGRPYWAKHEDGSTNLAYVGAKSVANQLAYVNHSINFFLYCLTGERFRSELRLLFCCGKSSKQSEATSMGNIKIRKMVRNFSETNLYDNTTICTSPNGKYTKTVEWPIPRTPELVAKETVA